MAIVFTPLDTAIVRALRASAADAYGLAPERHLSDGDGVPCRHCLDFVPEGEPYLICAHRPFAGLHPYAETGPIFLCATDCAPGGGPDLPPFLDSPSYILRGYGPDERIVYGTGRAVARADIVARGTALLARPDIAFVHVRSASNTCYHCRIDRAGDGAAIAAS